MSARGRIGAVSLAIAAVALLGSCNAAPVAKARSGFVTVVFEDGSKGLRILAATHSAQQMPPNQPMTGARWRVVPPPNSLAAGGASTVAPGSPAPRASAIHVYCVNATAGGMTQRKCLQPLAHRHLAPRHAGEKPAVVQARALVGTVRLPAAALPVEVEVVAADGRRAAARSRE